MSPDVSTCDIPKLIAERLAAHPAMVGVREELQREVLYGTGEGEPQGERVLVSPDVSLPCRTSPDGYHCSCTHEELGGYECCYLCHEPCVESVR